ncbi:MAG: MarR family transcriptional regulator [Clostridia bacterium]|nr:MarR family transcriptional regulator [Clostridia bacterium]
MDSISQSKAAAIKIRTEFKPGDAGSIIQLHGWIYEKECGYNQVFEAYVCKTFFDFLLKYNPEKDRVWIAEDKEQAIGAIAIVGHSTERAQLRWFILHPEYRDFGLGKKLLYDAIQYCRDKGYKQVFLDTTEEQTKAIAMYTKAGFVKVAEHENKTWGKELFEETYELNLP